MSLKDIKSKYSEGKISKPEYINKMHEIHRTLFEYADWLKSNDVCKIEIASGEVFMTTRYEGVEYPNGFPVFVCDRDDQRIAPIEIINFGSYEKDEFLMMNKLMPSAGTFLDIGANIGFYSTHLAKIHPQLSIHSFEPLPKTYSYLKKHVELNNCEKVNLHNFGCSDKNGEFTYYYYSAGSGNASMAKLSDQTGVQEIQCKVRKLDEVVSEQKLKVDFIKCDVEGAELFVFKGGLETIKRDRPIVFTEILRKWSAKFNYNPNEIFELFYSLGYKAFVTSGKSLKPFTQMDEETIETNFFFIPEEKTNL